MRHLKNFELVLERGEDALAELDRGREILTQLVVTLHDEEQCVCCLRAAGVTDAALDRLERDEHMDEANLDLTRDVYTTVMAAVTDVLRESGSPYLLPHVELAVEGALHKLVADRKREATTRALEVV